MHKPSPLQICFGISILLHVALFGTIENFGFFPAKYAHQSPGDSLTLTIIAAPDEPAAVPLPAKAVAPVPPVTVEKPVENPPPTELPKQTVTREPQPAIAVPVPVQAVTLPKQMPQTIFRDYGPPANPAQANAVLPAQSESAVKPDYLKNPEPVYPEQARRHHQEGLVLLVVRVTAQGHAGRVEIKKSSGFSLLDNAAVQAVRDWEFQPARLNLLPLESEIEVPVRFELRKQ